MLISGAISSGSEDLISAVMLLRSQKGQISSTISRLSSSVTSSEKPPVVTASGIQSTFASGCHLTLLAPPLGSPTISSPSLMKTGISSHSFSTMRAYCSGAGWPSVSTKAAVTIRALLMSILTPSRNRTLGRPIAAFSSSFSETAAFQCSALLSALVRGVEP